MNRRLPWRAVAKRFRPVPGAARFRAAHQSPAPSRRGIGGDDDDRSFERYRWILHALACKRSRVRMIQPAARIARGTSCSLSDRRHPTHHASSGRTTVIGVDQPPTGKPAGGSRKAPGRLAPMPPLNPYEIHAGTGRTSSRDRARMPHRLRLARHPLQRHGGPGCRSTVRHHIRQRPRVRVSW